jgi:hypothetical protein
MRQAGISTTLQYLETPMENLRTHQIAMWLGRSWCGDRRDEPSEARNRAHMRPVSVGLDLGVEIRDWLRGLDLNQRPLGYEPNELPGCSTPHNHFNNTVREGQSGAGLRSDTEAERALWPAGAQDSSIRYTARNPVEQFSNSYVAF